MKKLLTIVLVAGLALGLFVLPGCERAETADETAADATADVELASHDCDGGCGMKDVPMDRLTKKDDKYYCAGCLAHMEQDDHTGHGHD